MLIDVFVILSGGKRPYGVRVRLRSQSKLVQSPVVLTTDKYSKKKYESLFSFTSDWLNNTSAFLLQE